MDGFFFIQGMLFALVCYGIGQMIKSYRELKKIDNEIELERTIHNKLVGIYTRLNSLESIKLDTGDIVGLDDCFERLLLRIQTLENKKRR